VTDWYYGQGGNNGNTGASFAARKATYANFRASLVPGDVVYLCATTAGLGNQYTSTEQIDLVSGVHYRVYDDRYVKLEVSTTSLSAPYYEDAAIRGLGVSGFTIAPGAGYLELGDASDWDPVSPSNGQDNFASRRQISLWDCSNFQLIGTGTGDLTTTDSNFKIHGGRAWVQNFFNGNCHDYIVSGVDFSKGGTNNTETNPENPGADQADLMVFGGYRALIEYCTFQYGGHINARFSGRWQIARHNWFDGDWDGITPNAREGHGTPIERSGQRCAGVYSGALTDEGETASPWGPFMYEDNIFNKAGSAGDEGNNGGSELNGYHVIVRGNYVWDCIDNTFRADTFDDLHDVGLIKIYNNTCYGNGKVLSLQHVTALDAGFIYCDVLNNIFDEMAGSFRGVAFDKHFQRRATSEITEGFSNGWKGGRYSANIAKMAAGSPDGTDVTIDFRTFSGAQELYTWTSVDNTYPANWTSDNVMGSSPTYAGNPAGGQRTKAAFAPNGGIETGAAIPHATANGSGTNSTTLTLDAGQAYMFKDSWGMGALGVEGDYIQIDGGVPVQISAISNYASNIVTLAEPRSWSDNAEVIFCTTEDDGFNFTIWADIGAGQSTTSITPDPAEPVMTPIVMCFR